jgi:Kef-type K+ transport system membrane component KefB
MAFSSQKHANSPVAVTGILYRQASHRLDRRAIALIGAYVAFCWWALRPLLLRLLYRSKVTAQNLSPNLVGILIGAIFLSGMATYSLGIFAIFGGFIMGVLLHD